MNKRDYDYLLMCPKCKVILKPNVWARRKTHNGLAYSCEKCGAIHHKEDLRRVYT